MSVHKIGFSWLMIIGLNVTTAQADALRERVWILPFGLQMAIY